MSEYDSKEILIVRPSEQYAEKRQAESQKELLSVIKELEAWHARARRKSFFFTTCFWVGLLLLLLTVVRVLI